MGTEGDNMNRAIAALVMALRDPYVAHDEHRTIEKMIATLRKLERVRADRIDDDMEARRLMLSSGRVTQR